MVSKIREEFQSRKRLRQRSSPAEVKRRKEFLENLRCTFWVVQPEYENKLKESYPKGTLNQRDTEDWLYLEGVRGMIRTATVGSLDTKLEKRNKRIFLDQQAYEARKKKASASDIVHGHDEDEEYDESCTSMYTAPIPRPAPKLKKLECFTDDTYLLADSAGISNRVLTKLAASIIPPEKNLDHYNVSVKTMTRRWKAARTSKAREIVKNQLGNSNDKYFALHWDGKIIKSLTHVGKDIEHVAVILTGTDGQEALLSIIGIDGPSTADNEAKHIIQVCKMTIFTFYIYIYNKLY